MLKQKMGEAQRMMPTVVIRQALASLLLSLFPFAVFVLWPACFPLSPFPTIHTLFHYRRGWPPLVSPFLPPCFVCYLLSTSRPIPKYNYNQASFRPPSFPPQPFPFDTDRSTPSQQHGPPKPRPTPPQKAKAHA